MAYQLEPHDVCCSVSAGWLACRSGVPSGPAARRKCRSGPTRGMSSFIVRKITGVSPATATHAAPCAAGRRCRPSSVSSRPAPQLPRRCPRPKVLRRVEPTQCRADSVRVGCACDLPPAFPGVPCVLLSSRYFRLRPCARLSAGPFHAPPRSVVAYASPAPAAAAPSGERCVVFSEAFPVKTGATVNVRAQKTRQQPLRRGMHLPAGG